MIKGQEVTAESIAEIDKEDWCSYLASLASGIHALPARPTESRRRLRLVVHLYLTQSVPVMRDIGTNTHCFAAVAIG